MSALPWLKTVGNKIVVASTDLEVTLRGVNVMGSEWVANANVEDEDRGNCAIMRAAWYANMKFEDAGIPALAHDWHGNIIVRGFASDPVNGGDSDYLKVLDEHASLAEANEIYVVFAWRSRCINGDQNGDQPSSPDDHAQQALVKLAVRYRGRPNVMYALQVEPHGVGWDELYPRYLKMVDAIQAAAYPYSPIIMIPGVDFSRDVSGAIHKGVPRDNVVYKSHPYNSESLFQQQFIDAYDAGLPVFIGEFAPQPKSGMALNDIDSLLMTAQQRNIGWTAWIFDTKPPLTALLQDETSFTPTAEYGRRVRDAMLKTPPLPTDDGSVTSSIDDAAFHYSGVWNTASGSAKFHGGDHYSAVANSSYQFSFTGTRLKLYMSQAPWHGIAAVSIDDGPETMIDCYSPTRLDQVLVHTSPPLPLGPHAVTVRVTGLKNPSATDAVVTADRADITIPPTVTVNDDTIGAGPNQLQYTGAWNHSPPDPAKYQGDDHYSHEPGASARIELSGTRIALYGARAPWHGIAAVSIDGAPATMVDYYAPTRQDDVVVYTSPVLSAGKHTMTIAVTGTKNPAATDSVVTIDRVEASTAAVPKSYPTLTYDSNGIFHVVAPTTEYYGYKPEKSYTESVPIALFVWMHGCGGYAGGDMWKIAPSGSRETQSYIAVSLGGPNLRDGYCWDRNTDGPKLLAAVADVQRYFNIDPRRVFVGGYSSGGHMAYRHGFHNAGLFAGILVENSDPFKYDDPATLMNGASWKIHVAHLAHSADEDYPLVTVTNHIQTLAMNGFPATVIVRKGGHWDPDQPDPDEPGKTIGTDYDLIHDLLPFLDKGWMSP